MIQKVFRRIYTRRQIDSRLVGTRSAVKQAAVDGGLHGISSKSAPDLKGLEAEGGGGGGVGGALSTTVPVEKLKIVGRIGPPRDRVDAAASKAVGWKEAAAVKAQTKKPAVALSTASSKEARDDFQAKLAAGGGMDFDELVAQTRNVGVPSTTGLTVEHARRAIARTAICCVPHCAGGVSKGAGVKRRHTHVSKGGCV